MSLEFNDYLATLDVPSLIEIKKSIDSLIRSKKSNQKKELLSTFRQLAEESGLTVSEISWTDETTKSRKRRLVKPSSMCFRNPENTDQTWTGRGRQPAWYIDALEAGLTREELMD